MSGYIGNIPVPQATQTRQTFTATASQTTFNTAGYSPGYIDVFLNGVKLAPADYTATNGSDVVLAVGAVRSDGGNTPVLSAKADGNVGIGTFSPKRHLHINDPSAVATKIQITNSATGSGSDGDGFQIGIGSVGQAAIEQRENQPLSFSTNNTERMRIDSSGNVGIGTTSPANLLHIRGGAATLEIDSSTNTANLDFDNSTQTARIQLANNDFATLVGGTERMRIDSGGRVGIGTSSPSNLLHVQSSGSGTVALFGDSLANNYLAVTRTTTNPAYVGLHATSNVGGLVAGSALTLNTSAADGTSVTERMRINSSGALLVGKTADNLTDAGQVFTTAGSSFTRSGGAVCQFNRNTSDGEIVRLSKDGTTVGSIGVSAGNNLAIGSTSGSHAGITFGTNTVAPMNVSNFTNADDAYDLGNTSARWQDLYLSGGVYLGGTGSANHLDDYEEGTFTPSIGFRSSTTGSLTYQLQSFIYIKIGSMVFISGFLTWTANNFTASSGAMQLQNLPFTASGQQNRRGGLSVTYSETNFTGVTMYQQAFRTEANETNMVFNFADTANGAMDSNISSHTNISSAGGMMITGTYSTI
jgi:hypothetical protein